MIPGSNAGLNKTTILYAVLLSSGLSLLTACDAVVDCFDNDGPVFSTTTLPSATLNQVYNQTITAAVENEPFDDRFDYQFTIVRGTLPAGVTAEQSGRTLALRGTPTELGTVDLEISVVVDDGLSATESGLCYRNRSRTFTLNVVQENS